MKNLIYIFCSILVLLASCKESREEELDCDEGWTEHLSIYKDEGLAIAVRGPFNPNESICFGKDSIVLDGASKDICYYTLYISSIDKAEVVVETYDEFSILIDSIMVSPVHLMHDSGRTWYTMKYATKSELEDVYKVNVLHDTISEKTYGKYLIESYRLDQDSEELSIILRVTVKGKKQRLIIPVIYLDGEVRVKTKEDRFKDKHFKRDSLDGKH